MKQLRRYSVAGVIAVLLCVPSIASAQEKSAPEKPVTDVIDLIGCTLCHQVDNRILGPSFKEVALFLVNKRVDAVDSHCFQQRGRCVWSRRDR